MTARVAPRSLPIVLHPLAVPVAAIINWWSSTALPPALLVRPLVIVIPVGLAAVVIATLIVRDRMAGVAAWSLLTAVTVDDPRPFGLLLVVAAVVVAVGIATRQVAWDRGPTVTRFLSTLAAVLLLMSLIDSLQTGVTGFAFEDIRRDLAFEGPAESFQVAPWVVQ